MATAVPIALLAFGGIAAVAIVVFALRLLPRAAFAVWAVVLFFVPLWVGVNLGFYWAGITLLTVLLIIVNWSVVPLRAADAWSRRSSSSWSACTGSALSTSPPSSPRSWSG